MVNSNLSVVRPPMVRLHSNPSVSVSSVEVEAPRPRAQGQRPDDLLQPLQRPAQFQSPNQSAAFVREQNQMQLRVFAPATENTVTLGGKEIVQLTPYRWSTHVGPFKLYGDRAGLGVERNSHLTDGTTVVVGGGLAQQHSVEAHVGHMGTHGADFGVVFANKAAAGAGWVHSTQIGSGSLLSGFDGAAFADGHVKVVQDCGDWVLVEQEHTNGFAPNFNGSSSWWFFGGGLHAGLARRKSITQRTWLRRESASRVMQQARRGWFDRGRRRVEALWPFAPTTTRSTEEKAQASFWSRAYQRFANLGAPPLPALTEDAPMRCLSVGDSLTISRDKRNFGGAGLALGGLIFGYYRSISSPVEAGVERLNEDQVQVTVIAPDSRTRSDAWAVNIPILCEFHRITVSGGQERERYTMALTGDGDGPTFKALTHRAHDAANVCTSAERQQIQWEVSTGGGLPGPSYLPFVNLAGWSQERRITEESWDERVGNVVVRTWLRTNSLETQKVHHGTRQQHIYAALRQTKAPKGTWEFFDLTLGAQISYDRFTPHWQQRLLKKMRTQFLGQEKPLNNYTFADNDSYSVSMQRSLQADDLRYIAKRPVDEVRDAAARVHANGKPLYHMVRHLADLALVARLTGRPPDRQADVVRHYLGNVGFRGMGALHHLLGADVGAWNIDVEHGAVAHAMQLATDLGVKYATPVPGVRQPAMQADVQAWEAADRRAHHTLAGDPVLQTFATKKAEAQVAALEAAARKLRQRLHA